MQPQSQEEIQPVIEQLQKLDARLDIRWNPKAVMTKRGKYSPLGKRKDPEYDGRWEIILHSRATSISNKEYTVLVVVTEASRIGGRQVLIMTKDGAYAPVGEWLLEYMRTWDAAQSELYRRNKQTLDREDELANSAASVINDRAAHQEAAERVYHEAAGPYFMGRGFGKGRRTSDTMAAPAAATP